MFEVGRHDDVRAFAQGKFQRILSRARAAETGRAAYFPFRPAVHLDPAGAQSGFHRFRKRRQRQFPDAVGPAVTATFSAKRLHHGGLFRSGRTRRPADPLHQAIVDSSRRRVQIEVHGDDGNAVSETGRELGAQRIPDPDIADSGINRGMMSHDQIRARFFRFPHRRRGQVEGKEDFSDVRARIDQYAAVVVSAVFRAVFLAQRPGRGRVEQSVNFIQFHRRALLPVVFCVPAAARGSPRRAAPL